MYIYINGLTYKYYQIKRSKKKKFTPGIDLKAKQENFWIQTLQTLPKKGLNQQLSA